LLSEGGNLALGQCFLGNIHHFIWNMMLLLM
jgi:hypothetical protein